MSNEVRLERIRHANEVNKTMLKEAMERDPDLVLKTLKEWNKSSEDLYITEEDLKKIIEE